MAFLTFFIGAISALIGSKLGQSARNVLDTQYGVKFLCKYWTRKGNSKRAVFHVVWLSDTIGSCGMGFGIGIAAALSAWLMRSHYQGASFFYGAGLVLLIQVNVSVTTGRMRCFFLANIFFAAGVALWILAFGRIS